METLNNLLSLKRSSRGRLATLFLVIALWLLITVLGAMAGSDSGHVTLLYAFPIALLAAYGGLRAGLLGSFLGIGLYVLLTRLTKVEVHTIGYLTHALMFLAVGGLGGYLYQTGARQKVADSRWFEMSNDMLVEASLDGYFTRLSDRWVDCLGWSKEELMSRPFRDFIHPDDLDLTMVRATALDMAPGDVIDFENRYLAKDGSYRWLLWCASSDENRKYAIARDITDRKRLEAERLELLGQMETLARTDVLTGLPNRRDWEERVEKAVEQVRLHGGRLALAIVDLDHFKSFNDSYGHGAGDELLAMVAVRWRLALRPTDYLARYGGEEFAILLSDCPPREAKGLVERLRKATPQHVTCSAGIAYWTEGDTSPNLVARADKALYEAKRGGRDRVVIAEAAYGELGR